MSSHSISLSVGLSIGLHVIALSGASFLLPNSAPNLQVPIEVVLVELSQPTHSSGGSIPSVAAVQSVLPKRSTLEPATANETVPLLEEQHDAEDIPSVVEEQAAKPARIVFDSHAAENNVAQGKQILALPADMQSSHLDEMSEIKRPDVTYLSSTPPRYPRLAQNRGWEGTVLLEVEVLSSGNVGIVRVARSSGHRVLDRAAQKAVETWRFSVNRTDGSGLTATVEIPVTFELDSQGVRNRG